MHRVILRRERQHARLRMVSADTPQRFKSAHSGHRQIHHDHIRIELKVALAGAFARFSFGDERNLRLRLQQQPKAHAYHRMIIDEQDADHAFPVSGICAFRRTP